MKYFFIIICFLLFSIRSHAQYSTHDTIRVSAIVINNDTLPHKWITEVIIKDKAPRWLVKQRRKQREYEQDIAHLRYNVYKVYPYAVAASFVLRDVDSALQLIESKDARKLYKERKEKELNKQFKNELENLTITQGQILVKLIARETGKPCYQIVKELKGGFNARIWQTVAVLFNNNLKSGYSPTGDDAMIESIVKEIVQRGHYEKKRI
ncbi:MAG: DUF4294 domain-containing protein [Chitinophagaceae bacterium]